MRRWACALLFVTLAGLPLHAQTSAPERRTIAVSVLDKDGKAVHGLTAENFRGEFRGQPVRILSAAEDSSPRRIAIVVDNSASMRPHSSRVWTLVGELLIELGSSYEVAVYSLNEEAVRLISFTQGSDARRRMFNQLKLAPARGATPLYDRLVHVSREFGMASFGDAICLITDGYDTTSRTTPDELEVLFARTSLRLLVLRFPDTSGAAIFLVSRSRRRLHTGDFGAVVFDYIGGADDLQRKRSILNDVLGWAYRVELELSRPSDKPRKWKLEVVGADGKKLKDVDVAYPRLLVPLSEKK